MPATETSREAYRKIKEDGSLGARQAQVLAQLQKGPKSNADIARVLQVGVERITPRVGELRAYGLVEEAGKKVDPCTRMTVMVWQVVPGPYVVEETDVDAEQHYDFSWTGSVSSTRKEYPTLLRAIGAARHSSADSACVISAKGVELWPFQVPCPKCGKRMPKGQEQCWECQDAAARVREEAMRAELAYMDQHPSCPEMDEDAGGEQ